MLATDFPTVTAEPVAPIRTQVRLEEDEFNSQSISFIEGTNWSVVYYNQFLTSTDNLALPDPALPETEQQYIKYDMPIKVLTALSGNVPSEITGTASISQFKPSVNDVFVTKILGGTVAIFKIDEVEKKNMFLKSIYEISYSLFSTSDDYPELINMLNSRTIKGYVHNTNTNFNVRKPLLKDEEVVSYEQIESFSNLINKDYISLFYNKRDLFLLTHEDNVYFDPLLNTLYYFIIGGKCNQFNNNLESVESTIVKTFIDRNVFTLNILKNPKYKRYVFEHNTYNLYLRRLGNNLVQDVDYIMSDEGDIDLVNTSAELPILTKYLVNDLTSDNLTPIEHCLSLYINDDAIPMGILKLICEQYFSYTDPEKYHYGILIMMLIKYTLSREE